MSREGDVHPIVDVEPLWVVVHLLGYDGDLRHESECLNEVFEDKALLYSVSSRCDSPSL